MFKVSYREWKIGLLKYTSYKKKKNLTEANFLTWFSNSHWQTQDMLT